MRKGRVRKGRETQWHEVIKCQEETEGELKWMNHGKERENRRRKQGEDTHKTNKRGRADRISKRRTEGKEENQKVKRRRSRPWRRKVEKERR